MPRSSRTLLAASISAALFVPQTQAEAMVDDSVQELPAIDQCLINVPEPENPNQQPVTVEADRLEAINGDKATYQGDVVVVQGNKRFEADQVTLHQSENIIVAEGNVEFSDGTVKSTSDRVTNSLSSENITLENTQYKFLCEPGRGNAAYIARTGKAVYEIDDGSITSCPEGDNAWTMKASGIEVDQNEEVATFYHPRFEVLDVPVFYVPYLTVPIGDTRKTGFLYPTASYGSSDGLEVEVPFYWNIAPNYDLETTIKHMQLRGTQLNSKFRYLTTFGEGEIDAEYLPSDRKFEEKGDRWGFQYKHEGIYEQAWKFNIDYSQVSDVDYFTDVDSSIGSREDGQLVQEGQVQYRAHNWDATLLTRDFQVLTESDNLPYHILPQLKLNYYAPELLRYLDFDVISHITRFDTEAKGKPSATRVHIEPGLTVPLGTTWGSWVTEARLLSTYYQQDLNGVVDSELEEQVNRIMPEVRSLAGVVLERDTVVMDDYTQTLEPQIQYLYIPEVEQNNIANYDTTLLQTDYYGLFRSRKYSGVDKIQGANQFSYGASSRFYDSDYKERLSVSFGQIIYLDRTNRLDSTAEKPSNYSAWAVEMDFNYGDYLFYHGGIQYDVDSSEVQLGNSTLEYRFDKGYLQGNYRYVTRSYIENTLGDSLGDLDAITEDGISQGGLLASYQLTRHWDTSLQYFYDFTTEQTIEWLGRIHYTSDCWYVGFSYSNQLRNWKPDFNSYPNSEPKYESNFSVNFGIIGFGTNLGGGSGSSDNSLGYGRPFFLNN
ncbi:LPS assembly protein LptD [Vibrio sinaloensis]|uniref:LPS-assembly protein LptD n=1 Tax=Photobacterium sp. (strain ATCC 43367) TaxID=379097 RepID=A0A0A5HXR1_PHOS4|nr:LPS assembly protein LptD [Vibrio sinaloensis]KGY08321.1 LPS biosynthesis protein [Vibrio sinaloensis]